MPDYLKKKKDDPQNKNKKNVRTRDLTKTKMNSYRRAPLLAEN